MIAPEDREGLGPQGAGAPSPGGGPEPGAELARVPWEDADRTFPESLTATWLESLTAPARFFRAIDPGVPFARPLFYYLLFSVASALFSVLWGMSGGGLTLPPELAEALGYAGLPGTESRGWLLLEFFLSPFYALLALGMWTIVVHPFVRLFTESRRPLSETGRVFCYAAGPAVLTIVPWVGGIAALFGSFVLVVLGLRERHRTTTGRALAAVLVPAFALGVLAMMAFLFLLAALGSLGDLPFS
jgi:hypothetical protein